jgi:gliding motility-associated-like protein
LKRLAIIIVCLICCSISSVAQTDTLFWFAAPDLSSGHEETPNVFKICTYNRPATVSITMPANTAFQPIIFQLGANSTRVVDITDRLSLIENRNTNTVDNKGIKITATNSITCYYEAGIRNNPEIFVLKGRSAFGKKFLIPAQTRFQIVPSSSGGYRPEPKKGFIITAFENGTIVTIKPKNSIIGNTGGIPFIIRLNAGETYTINAIDGSTFNHLSGCEVSAEKNICITTYEDSVTSSPCSDLIGDQIIPESNAGLEYILVRGEYVSAASPNAVPQDFYFIVPTTDNTDIFVNGALAGTRNRGETLDGTTILPTTYITANKPILVMQVTGFGCEFTGTTLPNISCTGSQNISFIRSTAEPFNLNILCKSTEVNSFLLNGVPNIITGSMFADVPGTNGVWKAARLSSQAAVTSFLNQLIVEGNATNISNTNGIFHIGFLNGDTRTGGRLGYFSNYTVGNTEPQVASAQCAGNNIQLQSNRIANATYSWTGPNGFTSSSNNATINNATKANAGIYHISTTVQGCGTFTDSILVNVYYKPTIQLLEDTTICVGDTAFLQIQLQGKAPFSFNYQNQTFNSITDSLLLIKEAPNTTTVYNVSTVVDAEACTTNNPTATDIFQATVTVLPTPSATIIGNDSMTVGDTQTIQFIFTGTPPFNLVYSVNNRLFNVNNISNNSYNLTISPIENSLYTVVSLNDAGSCDIGFIDSLLVKVIPKQPFIPNAFSPNGDGINDSWVLRFMEGYPQAQISVFNRYGQLIFTTKNYNTSTAWNGTYNNKPIPVGTYYYVVDLKNNTPPRHGSVTVIR